MLRHSSKVKNIIIYQPCKTYNNNNWITQVKIDSLLGEVSWKVGRGMGSGRGPRKSVNQISYHRDAPTHRIAEMYRVRVMPITIYYGPNLFLFYSAEFMPYNFNKSRKWMINLFRLMDYGHIGEFKAPSPLVDVSLVAEGE